MGIRCTSKIDAFKLHKHVQWKQLFLHEFYLKKENIAQRTFSLFPIRLSSSSRILWSCLFLLVKSFLKKRRKIINFRIVSVGRGIYANFTTLSMLNQMKFCSQSDSAHSLLRGVVKLSAVGDSKRGTCFTPLPPTSDVLVLCSPTHEFAILLHLQHVQRQQPLEFQNLPRNSTRLC